MMSFDFGDDSIDLREVTERFEELRDARVLFIATVTPGPPDHSGANPQDCAGAASVREECSDYTTAVDQLIDWLEERREMAQTDVTLASHGDGDSSGELGDRLRELDLALASLTSAKPDAPLSIVVDGATFAIEAGPASPDLPAGFADEEEAREFKTLSDLLDELRGEGGDHQFEGDRFPLTLIHRSHFVDAMKELCEDIGDLPKGLPDYLAIDWKKTAENLEVDYSTVDVDGHEYLYRV